MNGIITIAFLAFSFVAGSHGYYSGRGLNNVYSPLYNTQRDLTLSCCCEDLSALVALVRALEEKECGSTTYAPNGSLCNAEELIMNLVNALVDLTTQALSRNSCHCSNQSGSNNNYPTYPGTGGSNNNHPTYPCNGGSCNNYPNNNGGHSHSDGGLLNLDLLNQNKKDNVLDLDLNRQHLLGVGLGGSNGGSYQGSKGPYNYNGRNANGGNDDGLVKVDLLNPNKQSNVADVGLGKQQLVGVGLGGGGSSNSQTSNSMTGLGGNGSNAGEGLVNVDLLNPNKQNNIVDVDLARQNLVGIGAGNRNDGTADK